jgi:small subunit ribosomal protein S4
LARPIGPRFKIARRLGVNVFNHPKALNRGVIDQKLSQYGKQLLEKQKLKSYYGILEKQFKRYVDDALHAKGNSGEVLVQNLERRLDNLVYRLGFGSTLRQARQMVVHGHMLVNGKKVNIPSIRINPGDVISLREKSRKNELFIETFQSNIFNLDYLEKDIGKFSGMLSKKPPREKIPIDIIDSRIIEFYSKN